ncbi:hypothetical protein PGT21_013231 [Puccinia graminis f. sp. tritici]|uniref:VPS9 domain-containing protein n=1 Tax=Puccinia graminis f. sp. tritici TaxID=56615 RepID=A0A5B0Q5U8_PUCGR|nr:hypothetical protein PGT21_013231 [Puccinia graminis f. sp. tritici]KAA1138606.1 hypothetical protein PGTUg99_030894 [Puccinia graminis f. sp. tritici]
MSTATIQPTIEDHQQHQTPPLIDLELASPSLAEEQEQEQQEQQEPEQQQQNSVDHSHTQQPTTPSQSESQTLQINTRNRASSWSLFRRNSISSDRPDSLPSNLLSRLTTPSQPSPPPSAPLSGPTITTTTADGSTNLRQTHSSTGSGSFSLSSLAFALKRPLNLNSTPSPSRLSPPQGSPQHSPSSTRSTHELSSRDADPDPTPSVPPRLVVESPSEDPPPVPFDFNLFLEQMRWPQAEPIAKYLRSFLKEFTKRAHHPTKQTGVAEQVKVVNDFLDFISIKMREIPDGPWDPRTCNEAEFDNAVEAMEKLVMNRVWHLTFTPALTTPQPSQTDDLERDTVLSQKMNLFNWLTDRHLDLSLPSDEADGFMEFAKTELLKINSYKAPRDKMICILNCCKVIFGLIRHIDQSEGGADTFIPILILVVLRAQPKTLISNLQYIQRFRNPDKMQGENGYYMSSLNAAISFIERLEHSVLSNITQEEFEYNVEQAIVSLPRSPVIENIKASSGGFSAFTQGASSSNSNMGGVGGEAGGTGGGGERADPSPTTATSNRTTTSTSLPDLTRSWLFTTVPQLAEKAVSKPLNAIARIVDDLASESDDLHPTERQGLRRASSSVEQPMVDPNRRGSRRGGRPWSADSPRSRHSDLGALDPSSSSSPTNTTRKLSSSSDLMPTGHEKSHLSSTDDRRLDQDLRRIEALKRAEHAAKLDTLAAIFPQLESELLEVVLITHRGTISKAIDSLLEMS